MWRGRPGPAPPGHFFGRQGLKRHGYNELFWLRESTPTLGGAIPRGLSSIRSSPWNIGSRKRLVGIFANSRYCGGLSGRALPMAVRVMSSRARFAHLGLPPVSWAFRGRDFMKHRVSIAPTRRPDSADGEHSGVSGCNYSQQRCRGGAVCRPQFRLLLLIAARFRWQNRNLLIFLGWGFFFEPEGRGLTRCSLIAHSFPSPCAILFEKSRDSRSFEPRTGTAPARASR